MEPTLGFEPKTSSLPRKCSAAELCGPGGHDRIKGWWAGRESNPHSRRRLIYSQRSSPPAQPTHGLRLPSETRCLVVKRMTCAASSSIWSRRRDSNPEPAVYKTAALPIELRRRRRGRIPHPRGSVQRRPMDLVRRRSMAVPQRSGFRPRPARPVQARRAAGGRARLGMAERAAVRLRGTVPGIGAVDVRRPATALPGGDPSGPARRACPGACLLRPTSLLTGVGRRRPGRRRQAVQPPLRSPARPSAVVARHPQAGLTAAARLVGPACLGAPRPRRSRSRRLARRRARVRTSAAAVVRSRRPRRRRDRSIGHVTASGVDTSRPWRRRRRVAATAGRRVAVQRPRTAAPNPPPPR